MINDVLVMLKEKLNNYFKLKTNAPEDKVAFADGSKMDTVSFPLNNVIPLLINVEEEKLLRAANRFEGLGKNGMKTEINPTVKLSLWVLFVSKFSDYEQSLKFLSLVITFFQRNQVFDQQNTPSLNPEISKLRVELVTLPISQQNEIWSSLKASYTPSVLYRISMLVFHDDQAIETTGQVKEIHTKLSGLK